MSGILLFIVPVELLFVFFVFAFLLELGTATGLIVAFILSSTTAIPLLILHRLKTRVDQDLHTQIADECEGIVEKISYGSQMQFAGILIDGEHFRIPHELAFSIVKKTYVRITYAQHSRIVLGFSS